MARIGYAKLTERERDELAALLVAAFSVGGAKAALPSAAPARPNTANPDVRTVKVYEARIESDNSDVLRLDNGAILQITSGYVGYLGYRKRVVLFGVGSACRVWIEGKRSYRCDLVRVPQTGAALTATIDALSAVRARGALLELASGQLFEVDQIDLIHTSLWLPASEVLVISGWRILNLSQGDQIVSVRPAP